MIDENVNDLWLVHVRILEDICNPMEDDVWGCGPITTSDVLACEDNSIGKLPAGMTAEDSQSWEYNVARISWLVENGWSDEEEPITVDMYPGHNHNPIQDGNHRLSAAIILELPNLYIAVSGDLDYLEENLQPLISS